MKRWLYFLKASIIICILVLASCTKYSSNNSIATNPAQSTNSTESTIKIPNAPTNLIPRPQSQTTAYLQWTDTANNEDGFKIYRDGNVVGTVTSVRRSWELLLS